MWVKNKLSVHKFLFYGLMISNAVLFAYSLVTDSYPWWLVFLYGNSLVGVWIWVLKSRKVWGELFSNRFDWCAVGVLISIALIVYLYRIEEITPGMWGDEVTVGFMGLKLISAKEFTPFLFINYGHPTPLLYLTGWTIAWLGRTMTAIRLVSVLFGALNIGLMYVLLRQWFNRWVSGGGALLLLWCYGYIVATRFAYEMTAAISFELLAWIWLVLAVRTRQLRYWIAFGLSIGMGLMTYLSFRLIAIGLIVLAGGILYQKTFDIKQVAKNNSCGRLYGFCQ